MLKTVGIKNFFITIFLICLCRADIGRTEGYFRLVLIDGTVVEGEMIRVTPATIEIDPYGPETFASYNQSVISDIVYMKQKPGGASNLNFDKENESKTDATGILTVRFNIENAGLPDDEPGLIHDYVMIDGRLYFTGLYADFYIELPPGNHTLELCGINMAYYEPTDFYSLENGGTTPRIWKQDNPFTFGKSMNIDIRRDSAIVITLEKRNRDCLFVSSMDTRVSCQEDFLSKGKSIFKLLSPENGIIPGKLVFEELPKNHLLHDSLEYRYVFVFSESEWARFNDAAYLPGNYVIEARAMAWNRWKDKLISETVSRCEMEIKSGHTTIVKFESLVNRLDYKVIVLPSSWFEISTRESE